MSHSHSAARIRLREQCFAVFRAEIADRAEPIELSERPSSSSMTRTKRCSIALALPPYRGPASRVASASNPCSHRTGSGRLPQHLQQPVVYLPTGAVPTLMPFTSAPLISSITVGGPQVVPH